MKKRPRRVIIFNKPFDVLAQFTDQSGRRTPKEFIPFFNVYPVDRRDSEGLLLLTNDGRLQAKLTQSQHKPRKSYFVQVEGMLHEEALVQFRYGLPLKEGITIPAEIHIVDTAPDCGHVIFPFVSGTCWLRRGLCESRNRKIRRMTSHIGFPALHLVRVNIREIHLQELASECWKTIANKAVLANNTSFLGKR